MKKPELSTFDPRKVCAFVGAGIATLLGLPWILVYLDPYLIALVKQLYPESFAFIYWLVKLGIYVMFFTLLQSVLYLAITSAVAAIAAHAFRFAL